MSSIGTDHPLLLQKDGPTVHIAIEDNTPLNTLPTSHSLHDEIHTTNIHDTYSHYTPSASTTTRRNRRGRSPIFHSRKRHPTQSTLFQFLPNDFCLRYDDDDASDINEPWGDTYKTKTDGVIRIWYSNPCGLGLNPTNSKSHNAFAFLSHHSQADIVCLAETNLRWPSLKNTARLNHRLHSQYQQYYIIKSYNRHEDLGKCQRGGTATFAVGQTSLRARRCGTDTTGLGR